MGEVNITINSRTFKLGCDDGEEEHLLVLSEHLGKHVENLRKTMGKAGDEQLYLMAGLMVCDELWEARDLLIKTKEMLRSQSGGWQAISDSQQNVRERQVLSVPQAAPSPIAAPVRHTKTPAKEPFRAPVPAARPASSPPSGPLSGPTPGPANSPANGPTIKTQLNSTPKKS